MGSIPLRTAVSCLHGVWRARSRRRERNRAARPAICRRICPREMLFPSLALAHVRRAPQRAWPPPSFHLPCEPGARRIRVARRGGATSGRFFASDRAATKKVSSTWRAEARRAEAGSGGRGPPLRQARGKPPAQPSRPRRVRRRPRVVAAACSARPRTGTVDGTARGRPLYAAQRCACARQLCRTTVTRPRCGRGCVSTYYKVWGTRGCRR